MSAPARSLFNLVTAAEDRVGRLEARMALLPREVMAVAAEPVAQPEVVAVAAVVPVAQQEAAAAAVAAEPDVQREAAAVVVVAAGSADLAPCRDRCSNPAPIW